MSEGITWIGAYSLTHAGGVPGMRGHISLTAARGIGAEEFLMALGADLAQLEDGLPYTDWRTLSADGGTASAHANWAMYGVHGEWVYVLEDWGMATWYTSFRKVEGVAPYPDEEVLCLTMNSHCPPSLLVHAPGDGDDRRAEFGETTGSGSALDEALQAAGAVLPPRPDALDETAVARYEAESEALPRAVFAAVGSYTGLVIDQDAVEAGDLPLAVLPGVT
ncbi:hypothetical protein [Streptomyces halstedii]|uniref:Uncharacterized protein n=1 Tax=Streptomyces halstedii TaxID=1944 RepID=A0A6N9U861_STRHA|nr:hypothetical protein [Streptomyces halstedii]NEA16985.1 hypothetical protein [Streptomyces halstedii]